MQNDELTAGKAPSKTDSAGRKRVVPLVLGAVVLAALVFAFGRIRANRLPTMDRSDYETAKTQWADAEITDYEISIEVKGMQPGKYDVVVKDGIAIAARFDGRDLKRQRTFGTWAVTGMFDTLARDLETNDKHAYLLLKAEFDPDYGYPTKYERIEMRTGAHDTLRWEVTGFVKN